MKKLKESTKIMLGMVIGLILSTVSYVLANSIIDSKNVFYKDNSGLAVNNVQDAIDGTCTKFEEKVDTFLDKVYPVGSIYISTTMSTAAQVKAALGGEWQAYGNDKVLRGTGSKAEVTGGSDTVTLTTDNLPSHSHSFTPAGSVSSTFKGTAVNSGNQSANHTHSTTATAASFSLKANSSGAHSHTYGTSDANSRAAPGSTHGTAWNANYYSTSTAGAHEHSISGSITVPALTTDVNSANHYHSVTAAGTVTSTFSGTASNTGATGKGTAVNVQNSYITVFMYKRIS